MAKTPVDLSDLQRRILALAHQRYEQAKKEFESEQAHINSACALLAGQDFELTKAPDGSLVLLKQVPDEQEKPPIPEELGGVPGESDD